MTFPTRPHTPGHTWLAVVAVTSMTVLFLLFDRSFIWLAAGIAIVALLPLAPNDLTARQVYWRTGAAALLLGVGLLIWLT